MTGKLPENPFTYMEDITHKSKGSSVKIANQGKWNESKYTVDGIFGTPVMSSPFLSSVIRFNQYNLAVADLRNKVKDSDFDAAVFAGEGRETFRMFEQFARSFNKAANAANAGDLNGVLNALGLRRSRKVLELWAANVWLVFNYGIYPLISDIQSALKEIDKNITDDRYYLAKTRKNYLDHKTIPVAMTGGVHEQDWDYKLETSARVKYRISDPSFATASRLGLTNPFPVIWELTKLSFVVDWGLKVGNWLSQFDALIGKEWETGSLTQFERIRCRGEWVRTSQAGYDFVRENVTYGWEFVSCERRTLTATSVPFLPGWKYNADSSNHLLTAAALFRQRL